MKQVNLHGPNDVRIDEVESPRAGADDVVVAVDACGICGSDVSYVALGGLAGPTREPMPLGHEVTGTLAEVGTNVPHLRPGMRVVVNPMSNLNMIGNGGPEGGFTELLLVRNAHSEPAVLPVPADLSPDAAALVEPLSVAAHAVNQARVTAESRAVVLGAGPIGLGVVVALQQRGVRDIVVVDLSARRLAAARQLGADATVDPTREDLSEVLGQRHGHAMLFRMPMVASDVFFECTGVESVMQDVIGRCRPGARIVLVAVYKHQLTLDPRLLLAKEVELIGSIGYPHEFPAVIAWLSEGKVDVAPMISHRFPLAQFAEAFAVAADPHQSTKVLVLPRRA
jgi:(R,R)-butanediol dehydrogenase/meso-butanediol dehydrogenase/diacetyl reductase